MWPWPRRCSPSPSSSPCHDPVTASSSPGGPSRPLREQLRRIPSARNVLAVVSTYAQTILVFVLRLDRPPRLPGLVLLGRAHAQLAALMHEAAHRLLFRNRR